MLIKDVAPTTARITALRTFLESLRCPKMLSGPDLILDFLISGKLQTGSHGRAQGPHANP